MLKRARTAARLTALLAAGLMLTVSGCTSDTDSATDQTDGKHQRPTPAAPAPTRALVVWADTMCGTTSALEALKKTSAAAAEAIGKAGAESYLSTTSAALDEVARGYAGLTPSDIAAADRLSASLARTVNAVKTEVSELADAKTLSGLAAAEKADRATRVAKLVASIEQPEPALPAVAAGDPALAASYNLAPRCTPLTLPTTESPAVEAPAPERPAVASPAAPKPSGPTAADGTDVSACADGACQILVGPEPVDFVVGKQKVTVSVKDGRLSLHHTSTTGLGSGTIMMGGRGGTALFGQGDGPMIKVKVTSMSETGAVLDISTVR
jgi:hypothetical protein